MLDVCLSVLNSGFLDPPICYNKAGGDLGVIGYNLPVTCQTLLSVPGILSVVETDCLRGATLTLGMFAGEG